MEMTKEAFCALVEKSALDTYEKARKIYAFNNGHPAFVCSCCGNPEVADFDPEVSVRMIQYQYCFTCMFWEDIVSNQALMKTHYVTSTGTVYNLIRGEEKSYFRGHGGAMFHFIHEDGTKESCNNVWCRGDVPPQFIGKFKKTKVVSKNEYEAHHE